MDIVEWLLAPKGLLFGAVTIVLGAVSAAIYLLNAPHREAIDAALEKKPGGGVALGMFALCGRNRTRSLTDCNLIPPERLWCYDKRYLDAFIARAASDTTSFGDTALQRYLKPTLIPNDLAFAIVFAIFTALAAIALGSCMPWTWARYAAVFCALMGLAYGVADVLEDRKLASLLKRPSPPDDRQAAAANRLTRAKLATITLSLVGMSVFLLLGGIRSIVRRVGG